MATFFETVSSFQVVEGLPNDVLIVFIILALIMAYFARYFMSLFGLTGSDHARRSSTIHPDSEDAISDTRRHLFGTSGAAPSENRSRINGPDAVCPICLGQPIRLPIETNCGHVFCCRCFTTYCAYDRNQLEPVRCPVCRQRVTLLLPGFGLEEARSLSPDDRQRILDPIRDYNLRFSGEPRSWAETVADLPTLMRHLIAALFSESTLSFVIRIRVFIVLTFATLYFLSPIDLLPESLLGIFGFFDDLFIFFMLAVYVTMLYRNHAAANAEFLGPGIDDPPTH